MTLWSVWAFDFHHWQVLIQEVKDWTQDQLVWRLANPLAKLTANNNNDKPRQDTAFGPTEALSLIVGFPSDVTTLNRTVAAVAKLQLNDQLHIYTIS